MIRFPITLGLGRHHLADSLTTWRQVGWMIPYMKEQRVGYFSLATISVLQIGVGLFFAWFMKNITEAAMNHQLHRVLVFVAVGLCACVLNGALIFGHRTVTVRLSTRFVFQLKSALFQRILTMPLLSRDKYQHGDLVSRLTIDIDDIGRAVGTTLPNLFRLPLSAAAALVYVQHINARLAWWCLLFVPAAAIVGMVFSRLIRQNRRRLYGAVGQFQSFLHDSLSGQVVVKSFGLERPLARKFQFHAAGIVQIQQSGATLNAGMASGASISGFVLFLTGLSLGAVMIARGQLSVGDLLAFVTLMSQTVQPLVGVVGHFGGMQGSLAALDRVIAVFKETAEDTESPMPSEQPFRFQTLDLRGLSFRYDDAVRALEDINLSIPNGSTVAVVGPSGAGKSTLLKVLAGLYPPTTGGVFLNGSHTPCSALALRSASAYVPQETFLFQGTVRDNLLYGNPEATNLDIVNAAKAANIHDDIVELRDGYDTDVGAHGSRLSGGQRQRLTIARALLQNAPILLLDEATAALDTETEYKVQQALERLMQDRTTFVIAHRLSTVRHADLIVVMDRGRVVECGTDRQLRLRHGLYDRLYQRMSTSDNMFLKKSNSVHF